MRRGNIKNMGQKDSPKYPFRFGMIPSLESIVSTECGSFGASLSSSEGMISFLFLFLSSFY